MNIGFKALHPVTSFIFFVFAFTLCLISYNPFILFTTLLCGFIYDLKIQKKRTVSYLLKFILPLIMLITVFNGLFNHYGVTILFTLPNGNNFTLEAVLYGLICAVKFSAILFWLDCFNEIVTSDKIIYLFGRFSPKTALIISMVLRFIPLIRYQAEEISKAEKGIGNIPESANFIKKIKAGSRRLSILISWTLEKGIDTAESMSARGYGLKARKSYADYTFSIYDVLFIAFSVAALILNTVFYKKMYCVYNPIIEIPKPDIIAFTLIVFSVLILSSPMIFDLREEKLWSISK